LLATRRKWKVVPAARPDAAAWALRDAVPEPTLVLAVLDPYELDVPYSNQYWVEEPLGSTLPMSVAEEGVMLDAQHVEALGAWAR
jgi:hypothetical protein